MAVQQIDNLIKFTNSQGENTTGTLIKVSRNSIVMEVYNPYSIVQLSEILSDLCIRRDKRIIYEGRAVVTSLVNTGLMLIVSVTLIDPWQDLAELLTNSNAINQEVGRFLSDYKKSYNLKPEFQLVVVKIRSFLNELSRWLEQLDVTFSKETDEVNLDKQRDIIKKIAPLLSADIAKLFGQFEAAANKIKGDEIINHKMFAQHNLHPLLLRAPIVHRTFYKPLGYAGDYEMMKMMQRDPVEGPTVYTNLINKQFINFPISKSVSNRTDTLVNYLHNERVRTLANKTKFSSMSIACGPALELQHFISNDKLSENCEFNILDFDEHALIYAEKSIKDCARQANRKIDLNVKKESVHVLLKSSAKVRTDDNSKQYDLVYCSGLFDYLSDKVCARLLRLFYQWAKPGGLVYITNMHTSNPDRQMMEYIMEWFLIYRDEAQMRAMAPNAGSYKILYDETGVNIGLEIRKPLVG